ncbi:hypothetical protein ACRE_027580 [Hapsidospora chrysogenum ATCC 11550]|uniref:Uncharacterized protein n=1 Tax=Hapsidospora chrysogenum (strain ATCC 11550 / CBS 779.69 / DSM 880 / IAM 14645 / JCM 23072 / IMI 49137) TaxID=857340 RepID=A0A086TAN4_HAPC1|nr:hypothetical protein ACRE_027580 [Hapsidospora chrysogenum ATCC 11550]
MAIAKELKIARISEMTVKTSELSSLPSIMNCGHYILVVLEIPVVSPVARCRPPNVKTGSHMIPAAGLQVQ